MSKLNIFKLIIHFQETKKCNIWFPTKYEKIEKQLEDILTKVLNGV